MAIQNYTAVTEETLVDVLKELEEKTSVKSPANNRPMSDGFRLLAIQSGSVFLSIDDGSLFFDTKNFTKNIEQCGGVKQTNEEFIVAVAELCPPK